MTTSIRSGGLATADALPDAESVQTLNGLRDVIFGDDYELNMRVRDAVVGLNDIPESGRTYDEEAAKGPVLLRHIVAALGGSSRLIASDPWLRGALCEWAAVAAPRLLPVLSGHLNLVIGSLARLGDGSPYQTECLDELDRVKAIGALLHTELAGTNGPDGQTLATLDLEHDCITLTTPNIGAAKFMPNVAGPCAKTVIVTARLFTQGHDQGIFPFLLPLRTESGPVPGVNIVALPDKAAGAMDHALIRFQHVEVPREALLGGDWARFDDHGQLICELSKRERFHASIGALQAGRIDLGNAAVACARAAVAMLVNHAHQRLPAGGVLMADRDAVRHDLVSAVAAVYAMTALGAEVRDRVGAGIDSERTSGLWATLAKPILSDTARRILSVCRQRAAAHGALRINYLVDYEGLADGIIPAEGENQVLAIAAGRLPRQVMLGRAPESMDISTFQAWDTPADLPWWNGMLREREQGIARAVREACYDAFGAMGPDSLAVQMAGATGERLAAECLAASAEQVSDPGARHLVGELAAVWALSRVKAHGLWHAAYGQLSRDGLARVDTELTRRRTALAEQLPILVRAFEIPRLPAPMFSGDYLATWQRYAGWDQPDPGANDGRPSVAADRREVADAGLV